MIGDRIVRVSWRSFRLPFAAAFQTSRAVLAAREGLLVTVETAGGVQGIGEASPLPEFDGGTLGETAAAVETLARRVLGKTPADAWRGLPAEIAAPGPSARVGHAGLETALGDAAARAAGIPLWRWVAETSGITVEEESSIPVNAIIDAVEPEGVEREVASAVAAGFTAVKLKVGADGPRDLARIAAGRAAGGPALELRIDANGAWDEPTADAFLRSCEPYGVALCEQPLDSRRADCIEATARLRRGVSVPLALDESCRTAGDIRGIVAAEAADAIVLKPMLTGLREGLAMLAEARNGGLRAIVTTTFDCGVGTAMAAHLAALLPSPRPACGLATLERLEHPLTLEALAPVRGAISLPGCPGLGVSLDESAFARYRGALSETVRP